MAIIYTFHPFPSPVLLQHYRGRRKYTVGWNLKGFSMPKLKKKNLVVDLDGEKIVIARGMQSVWFHQSYSRLLNSPSFPSFFFFFYSKAVYIFIIFNYPIMPILQWI